MIDMHLADFDTVQAEVAVFCKECADKVAELRRPWVRWKHTIDLDGDYELKPDTKFEECVVVSLTDNAWRNRDGNHPNSFWTENIFEYDGRPKEDAP